jgi:hypothetical protein
MARKKENSVAALRDRPKSRPPMIVAPEREVPGISATAWAKPTFRRRPAHFLDRLDAMVCSRLFAHVQDDESAENEGGRHGNRVEQVGLDRLAKGQPEDGRGRKATNRLRRISAPPGRLKAPRATTAGVRDTPRRRPGWHRLDDNLEQLAAIVVEIQQARRPGSDGRSTRSAGIRSALRRCRESGL